jgi:PAS domain S-box-containing protein
MSRQDFTIEEDSAYSGTAAATVARGYELGVAAGARDTNVLLQELQIHQIELEIQNEELRRTQLTLAASRDRYFDLYEFAPVGYFTITHEGLITEINLKAATLLGLDRSHLIQRHFATIVADQDKDRWHISFKQMKVYTPEQQSSLDLRLIRHDQSKFNAHLDYLRIDGEDASPVFRITLTDITQIKCAEEKLRQSERLMHTVIDSVPSHIVVLDCDGVIVATNAAWRQFALDNATDAARVPLSSEIGMTYIDVCHQGHDDTIEDGRDVRSGIAAVMAGYLPNFNIEYPCHSSIQQRWFIASVNPLGAGSGGVVITHTDITERKLAEDKLRVAAIAFESQEGIFITNADSVILEVNQAFIGLTGYTAADAIGQSAQLLRSGHHDEAFYVSIWNSLDRLGFWQGEIWNRHKNAEIHPEWMTITAVPDKSGHVTHYVATLTDATEDRQRESQRLIDETSHRESLVREVHHRIKNDLQGVIGLLRSFSTQQPEIAAPITDAISQVQSIAVIHGLQGRKLSKVRLCELVREIAANHQVLFKTKIIVEIPAQWTPCRINETEAVPMALVLNELISNAVKHSNTELSTDVTIIVSRDDLHSSVKIVINNPGQLPLVTSGTGLQLVASLLPKTGSHLSWHQLGPNVSTQLELTAPIIAFESIVADHNETLNL